MGKIPQESLRYTLREQSAYVKGYVSPYSLHIYISILLVILSTALEQASPWIIKLVLDELAGKAHPKTILFYLLLLIPITLIGAVMLYWQRYLLISASRKAEFEMRNVLFEKLQYQSRIFFNTHPVGDIMSRATNDLERVRELLGPAMLHSARMILILIYTGICLFLISPVMAAAGLLLSLILPFASMKSLCHQCFKFF